MYRELSFDSEFFHKKVGELILDEQGISIPADVDLLYVKSKKDVLPELPGFHCSYGEKKVFYQKSLNDEYPPVSEIRSIHEIDYQLEDLYSLAYESGKYSRFHLDPQFKQEDFKRLYRTWIDQSLNGTQAKDVLVYLLNNKMAGFLTYQYEEQQGELGLLAVAPEFQGMGIGRAFFHHIEGLFLRSGIDTITFPTQAINLPACRFYDQQGYQIIEVLYIKHYYRDDTI
jgi:dTDP-4-amino-4,6-dideoxy-D-galactose acyltransferase